MLVPAVQRLDDTAAFLAALVTAGRRVIQAAAALVVGSMDALLHSSIAIVGVFMIAGPLRDALGVAAVSGMFRVMFTQTAGAYGNSPVLQNTTFSKSCCSQ